MNGIADEDRRQATQDHLERNLAQATEKVHRSADVLHGVMADEYMVNLTLATAEMITAARELRAFQDVQDRRAGRKPAPTTDQLAKVRAIIDGVLNEDGATA